MLKPSLIEHTPELIEMIKDVCSDKKESKGFLSLLTCPQFAWAYEKTPSSNPMVVRRFKILIPFLQMIINATFARSKMDQMEKVCSSPAFRYSFVSPI